MRKGIFVLVAAVVGALIVVQIRLPETEQREPEQSRLDRLVAESRARPEARKTRGKLTLPSTEAIREAKQKREAEAKAKHEALLKSAVIAAHPSQAFD